MPANLSELERLELLRLRSRVFKASQPAGELLGATFTRSAILGLRFGALLPQKIPSCQR
jgi:hypothetical protein